MNAQQAIAAAIDCAAYSAQDLAPAENIARATMYAQIAIAQSLAEIAEQLAAINERAEQVDERNEARSICA